MIRVIVFLLVVVAAASGLAWLADRPGTLVINWEGNEVETTVFHAIVMLSILLVAAVVVWSILRGVWQMPAGLGNFFNRRREKRGLDALSSGMIAIGAGDKSLATRYAVQARKSLPNEPLTHILRAQAAQLSGDRATSRRIFEAMLSSPDTEPLGLRGLFLEAEREGEFEAASQFADRALKLNPKVAWPVHALFDLQCKEQDWASALDTLAVARKHGHVERQSVDRKRAVLLTAQAQMGEESDPEAAMKLAEEAHNLAPDLVPASAIAGRLLAARGNVNKATKILQKAWRKGPHPDLATAYAFARTGDSPKDRLTRVKQLAAFSPHALESPIAVATAAIEARDFDAARDALAPLVDGRLTQRVCTLMARIEGEDGGNTGAVREWLARAVNAPRDPAWTADGVVADDWAPVSPVTGALDAFQWRVPVEAAQPRDAAILHDKIEELVQLGSSSTSDAPTSGAAAAIGVAAATSAAGAAAQSAPAASAPQPTPAPAASEPDMVDISPAPTAPAGQTTSSSAGPASASSNQAKPVPTAATTAAATPAREVEDVEIVEPTTATVATSAATSAAAAASATQAATQKPGGRSNTAPGKANASDHNTKKYEEAKARAATARAEANAAQEAEAAKAAATQAKANEAMSPSGAAAAAAALAGTGTAAAKQGASRGATSAKAEPRAGHAHQQTTPTTVAAASNSKSPASSATGGATSPQEATAKLQTGGVAAAPARSSSGRNTQQDKNVFISPRSSDEPGKPSPDEGKKERVRAN